MGQKKVAEMLEKERKLRNENIQTIFNEAAEESKTFRDKMLKECTPGAVDLFLKAALINELRELRHLLDKRRQATLSNLTLENEA